MIAYPGDKITNGKVVITIVDIGISLLPGMEDCFVQWKHSANPDEIYTTSIGRILADIKRGGFQSITDEAVTVLTSAPLTLPTEVTDGDLIVILLPAGDG